MIHVGAEHLDQIRAAAEQAYPSECCGLLTGYRHVRNSIWITGVHPSANVTQGSTLDTFEVDPALRFRLMHQLQESRDSIIGHYHSHPDKPAEPSVRDAASAHEPDLTWLIISVHRGRAHDIAAFVFDPDRQAFRRVELTSAG
ncbi:MAG: M67 family metallopeptidase [Hyphomicrobiales bacterium]|nr:M67 family metallopeptidase [Hyphomicrobiales bacterium]